MSSTQVAIITGGPSAERGISLKSAAFIKANLDSTQYTSRTIVLEKEGFFDQESGNKVDLNDFSLQVDGRKLKFDFVFLIIHGTPAEDGKIQGYFEMLGIPHSSCNTLVSALTFDKQKCKDYLSVFQIPMASSRLILKGENYKAEEFDDLQYPLFVKPNKNGSSYGVTKVSRPEDLSSAIDKSFLFDDEVIVEEFLKGTEFSCGVVTEKGEVHVLPLTEIVPKGDFFDYDAKYEGASEEITPGRIDESLSQICRDRSGEIYRILGCHGMIRIDYILVGEEFYLLEVNTIPGLSPTSIVPQQAIAYGWSYKRLLGSVIEDSLIRSGVSNLSGS